MMPQAESDSFFMSLFDDPVDPAFNHLPRDGVVNYYGPMVSKSQADQYFDVLHRTLPWQHDQALIHGCLITTARQVVWYGDLAYAYTYSGTTRHALAWTCELLELKAMVEQLSGCRFNACLLNLYNDGDTAMAWHSDDEKGLGKEAAIASVSLGAPRKFVFKHKREPALQIPLMLAHGSLLLMHGTTQSHWLHSLPKSKKVTTPRINLTFRSMLASTAPCP
jgi:alkylated DNA repair dioxygenase AlkB